MSEFLKVGGKYNNTAKGMSVNADGALNIERHNQTEIITLYKSIEKRDTAILRCYGDKAVDLSDWTSCCILVQNYLDVDAKLIFYTQDDINSSHYLKDADGQTITILLPHVSTGCCIITPEDYSILNYLKYFTGGIYFPNTPTSGKFTFEVMRKR